MTRRSNGDGYESRIRRLSDRTVDRIAAGEVITRPARVVAELIDNALDADARRVEIVIEGDGTDRITVRDDGHGMSRVDARIAVERHATSKLRDGQTPREAASLGFRGEALAAIAEAAGRLEIVTNAGDPVGTQVVAAEDDRTVTDAGRARGTTVSVTDLFDTRPARRESLAGPNAEFARISTLVADYALARPDVAVTLEHDGTETVSTPGTGWNDAVLGVYDRDVASRSTTIDATDRGALNAGEREDLDAREREDLDAGKPDPLDVPDRGALDGSDRETAGGGPTGGTDRSSDATVEIRGVLAFPSVTRATRDHIRVAVNGRPVTDTALERAVSDGYGRLIPDGREPVAAIDVRLPADEVDPNIHPAKREVGLRHEDAVTEAVTDVIADALTGVDLRRKAEVATDLETALSPATDDSPFADVDPIGQYQDLYILCAAGDELLVIDAHAAHERVNYERLQRVFAREPETATASTSEATSTPDRSVRTLEPSVTVSLTSAERAAFTAHQDVLGQLGFDAEPFGGDVVRLRRVPAPFGRPVDVDAFRDAISKLAAGESPADPAETLLADLACHPSIARGDTLDAAEMRTLLDRLGECDQPFCCPHGRPTVLSIEEATLAAGFDRPSRR